MSNRQNFAEALECFADPSRRHDYFRLYSDDIALRGYQGVEPGLESVKLRLPGAVESNRGAYSSLGICRLVRCAQLKRSLRENLAYQIQPRRGDLKVAQDGSPGNRLQRWASSPGGTAEAGES